MTDFHTRILLATDGSNDAAVAARTAVNLANKTGSELHVMYVEEVPRRLSTSEPTSLEGVIDPEFEEQMRQQGQVAASQVLGEQVGRHLGDPARRKVQRSRQVRVPVVLLGQ